jgi:hypothetical protein
MSEIKTYMRKQVYFEDVNVGDELPPVIKQYNLMKMAAFASVHGDWCPGHYDYDTIRKSGGEWTDQAPVAYGMQITAYNSQVLTDYMSPNGFLKKFKSRTTAPTYPFDTLTIRGKVIKKYVEDGENCVECEIWAEKQDGKTISGTAWGLLVLPSKLSKP